MGKETGAVEGNGARKKAGGQAGSNGGKVCGVGAVRAGTVPVTTGDGTGAEPARGGGSLLSRAAEKDSPRSSASGESGPI